MAVNKSPYPQNLIDELTECTDCDAKIDCNDTDIQMGVYTAVATLTEKEQFAIMLRYQQQCTFEEVGRHLALSKERARQILITAKRKMRHPKREVLYTRGLKGYIEMEAQKRSKAIITETLYAEYAKGYKTGYSDAIEGKESAWDNAKKIVVSDLDLSVRSTNCLMRANIKTVEDIISITSTDEIHCIRNLGLRCAGEVAHRIYNLGFTDTPWNAFLQHWTPRQGEDD